MLSVFSRLVIYFHAQVVDGQKKIITRLEKQVENVSIINIFFYYKDSTATLAALH